MWDKDSKLLRTFTTNASEAIVSTGFTSEIAGFVADSMVSVQGAIISVTTNSDGNTVVLTNEGETITLEKGKSYAVADEVGNGYIVKADGTILKTTSLDAANAGARGQRDYTDDPNQSVRFDKSSNTQFGFDAKRDGTLAQHYIQTTNGKYVAWKALTNGIADEVYVLPEGATDLNRIKYRRQIGTSTETITANSIANGQATLSLPGKANATNEELLAIYTASDTSTHEVVAGQINLVSYDKLPAKNLVLVQVKNTKLDNVSATTIQTQLNAIYKQALVSWNVSTTIQRIEVDGINEAQLDDGPSGMLSNYSGEMKQVLNAYLKNNTLADDTYYLFLVGNSKSGSIAGYMPRSKQAGFIFVNALHSPDEVAHTIAHELGHGAFHLKHTFSEFTSLSQNTTDNLMDYKGGIALNKYQWDHIHNPERVLSLFEDDEEGAFMIKPYWERAALVLQEYLDDKGFYDEVTLTCTGNKCIIKTKVFIATNVSIEQEFTFDSGQTEQEIFELLVFTYKVPYWEANDPFTQGFWEKAKNYLLIQDDKIARGEGWAIGYANFVADVVTGATGVPTIYGWVTGEHWRTGDELAWWEQVIGVLDVLPAEALAKAGISAMVIKIGSKYFDFAKVTQVTRSFLIGAKQAGLKVVMQSTNEIKIFGKEGGRQIGRFLNGVLEEVYWRYGDK